MKNLQELYKEYTETKNLLYNPDLMRESTIFQVFSQWQNEFHPLYKVNEVVILNCIDKYLQNTPKTAEMEISKEDYDKYFKGILRYETFLLSWEIYHDWRAIDIYWAIRLGLHIPEKSESAFIDLVEEMKDDQMIYKVDGGQTYSPYEIQKFHQNQIEEDLTGGNFWFIENDCCKIRTDRYFLTVPSRLYEDWKDVIYSFGRKFEKPLNEIWKPWLWNTTERRLLIRNLKKTFDLRNF